MHDDVSAKGGGELQLDVNKVVANVIVSAAESVAKSAGGALRESAAALADIFGATYREYLVATYRRVATIKTFINPQVPVDLYTNFVSVTLKSGREEFDETTLVERLSQRGAHFVISALAGRGKSVLMKYIALCKYQSPTGTIPLFLELRQLNSLSKKDLLAFLHATYKGSRRLSFERFLGYLKAGSFLLILDGFDEVSPDDRKIVESQILQISREYPNCSMIISGRPDERFDSWEKFKHVSICPMTLKQVENLIVKLEYDKVTKSKFLKAVKTSLYQTHESFLSTPLLATLMLLTFEQYADIPTKVHIFYDNAFETLFRKHDALKEQYVRVTRADVTVDVFRRIFSAFCAISYSEAMYSFTREQVVSEIEKAIKYTGAPCKAEDFLTDLIESVCLLQLEGFEYHFVHRSFQEYFCALFLANSDSQTRKRFINETWSRARDNVLPMLFDMAQDLVEQEWVREALDECLERLTAMGGSDIEVLLSVYDGIGFGIDSDGRLAMWYFNAGPLNRHFAVLRRLYPAHFTGSGGVRSSFPATLPETFPRVREKRLKAGDKRFEFSQDPKARKYGVKNVGYIAIEKTDQDWLTEIGLLPTVVGYLKAIKSIEREVSSRAKSRLTFLDELFQ